MSPLVYLGVLAIAVGSAALLTPLSISLGKRWGIVDAPGGRRRHKGIVPRIGGLGLYPAFVLAALAALAWGVPRVDPLEVTRLVGVLLGMGVVWITGLLDDRFNLPPAAQLVGFVAAAGVAIAFKVFIEVFNSPFGGEQIKVDWFLMVPISLAWILGMINTVNLVDGLDGLAAGVTAISALVLFIHMLRLGQFSVALLPLALLGCCLGFLPYNVGPARIFLGGGAYVLGFALGTIAIVAGAKVASALLVMWLPIVDVLWQAYTRWRRRQAVSLGDRGHLHLRLQDLGWPTSRIVLLYYGITAALGGIALFCPSRLLKLGILVAVALIALPLLAIVARASGDRPITGR
jgi:UDP-GlcNAc:undecaprenyl-phosphate GlcNAc-1-phosphate transferase